MMWSLRPLVLLLLLLAPARSGAWSDTGHQAVCEIAFLELTPATRKKVTEILSPEDTRFQQFALACTWADSEKDVRGSIQNARRDEHYVNVKRSLTAITSDDCGAAPRCLLSAIRADTDALKNSTGAAQRTALKFLGHWIGDLHQPLHVSYADDRGGNDIPVSPSLGCPQLHAVWDFCIPEDLQRQMGASRNSADLGRRLHQEITAAQRAQWRQGTVVDWAGESYAITRQADTKYCLMKDGSCCYTRRACTNQAGSNVQRQTRRLMHLPGSYVDREAGIAKKQLQKAGVRLAVLLENQLR